MLAGGLFLLVMVAFIAGQAYAVIRTVGPIGTEGEDV